MGSIKFTLWFSSVSKHYKLIIDIPAQTVWSILCHPLSFELPFSPTVTDISRTTDTHHSGADTSQRSIHSRPQDHHHYCTVQRSVDTVSINWLWGETGRGVCIRQEHRGHGCSGQIKNKTSLWRMTRKQQTAKQKHKDRSRGERRNSQTDKESWSTSYADCSRENLSGLPSPSRACQAITVMEQPQEWRRVSIALCKGQRERGIRGRDGKKKNGLTRGEREQGGMTRKWGSESKRVKDKGNNNWKLICVDSSCSRLAWLCYSGRKTNINNNLHQHTPIFNSSPQSSSQR